MKFKRDDIFEISTEPYDLADDKNYSKIDYIEWVRFIDDPQDEFIWFEDTQKGKNLLKNIDKVPDSFKERVFGGLNKSACYSEFDKSKGYYNIMISFNSVRSTVNISFECNPKIEDFKILIEMANYLNAILLRDGKEIIDEQYLDSLT